MHLLLVKLRTTTIGTSHSRSSKAKERAMRSGHGIQGSACPRLRLRLLDLRLDVGVDQDVDVGLRPVASVVRLGRPQLRRLLQAGSVGTNAAQGRRHRRRLRGSMTTKVTTTAMVVAMMV